jgi:7-cyano-7-deazaguanine synthase in queuosine biosynthesis/nucleoside 2-deoxyribosyltransferase
MSTTVVGGAYREVCVEPAHRRYFGSGVRGAAAIRENVERLVTVLDEESLPEVQAVLQNVPIDHVQRERAIEFFYDTPLSSPSLQWDRSDAAVQIPDIVAEDAVVFGMVEALPIVSAERVVVDPQHSLSLDQLRRIVSADELVIVANQREITAISRESDLRRAAELLLGSTGAAGIVVKSGAHGALIFGRGEGPTGIPAFVTPTVFPIGSGDVFTAVLASKYFAGAELREAALEASRRTAVYVTTQQTRDTNLDEDPVPTIEPTVWTVQDRPRVYIAASFANPEQRWSGRTMDHGIKDIGGDPVYPLRDVGEKQDAAVTAQGDLEALDSCEAVVLLADVARTGPFFEGGWATSRNIPTVVMNSDPDEDRYTMLRGTGSTMVADLSTAAYHAVWSAIQKRHGPSRAGRLLLLSGGLDSSAIAAIEKPNRLLFVDYGQMSGSAERAAARAIATHLALPLDELEIDLTTVGAGMLVDSPPSIQETAPEWFPYRNQHLATIAASHALKCGLKSVILGLVAGDGSRHVDGRPSFVSMLDGLISQQEGGVRLVAPHIRTDPVELIAGCGLPEAIVRQTYSCHTANEACDICPGCIRRQGILSQVYGTTD